MKVTSVYPFPSLVLILEFDHLNEYRVLDMKRFLEGDTGLLAEMRDNVEMFMTAKIDPFSCSVSWENGVDFYLSILIKKSESHHGGDY
ncbi:hypothetical protein PASE110613_14475 [Paenibacillus sediminis]|uniref:DUF2442 domain-containing protein n=1 Tax=Paenibacillus sediminis TaxID=664909 RepID=A0ABS4H7J4_9BACL|nr:hypothetical protein [Paenibacillus sediminis]MBP1938507.1 hypothetical protein [Paenibacillus sediminis]